MKNSDLSFKAFRDGIGGELLRRVLPMIPIDTIETWAGLQDAVIAKRIAWNAEGRAADWYSQVVGVPEMLEMGDFPRFVVAAALMAAGDVDAAEAVGGRHNVLWRISCLPPEYRRAFAAAIMKTD
ncbi:hypothetical protein ANOBCDAF_00422 [Pleomorphomonas sp. T1.2MG-36]|uniref:hypothetical protein n=1 Tax=Pleomorphomonas sp. T1.2MG-36 TaxID=3041167 RepID=UPI0024776F18|nr:hypothetical protein [Pleomorphomonas sp. T1.2MG-36]CAI9400134.1 hypothetical protein ANOBCDAF_00422 [Pleomorphomonas sp. T1.2MG-36]